MNSSVRYSDRVAESYAKRPIKNYETYMEKIDVTHSFLNSGMDVLEFGCGTGAIAFLHALKVKSYFAIDASPRMIEIANQRLEKSHLSNVRFKVSSLEGLAEQSQKYDAIIGLNVLHLMKEPKVIISTVYSLLKPNGFFICDTACLKDRKVYLKPLLALTHKLRITPYVNFFSRCSLERYLQNAGFSLVYGWTPSSAKDEYFLVACRAK